MTTTPEHDHPGAQHTPGTPGTPAGAGEGAAPQQPAPEAPGAGAAAPQQPAPHQTQPTTPLPESPAEQQGAWHGTAAPQAPAAQVPAPQAPAAPQTAAAPHAPAAQQLHQPSVQHHAQPYAQQAATTEIPGQQRDGLGAAGQTPHTTQGATAGASFGQSGSHQGQPAVATAPGQPKNRSGALLAGLAIGALLGGVVGGGVAAIVASNVAPQTVAESGGTGTLTLNNAENATQISGVAAVATPSVVTLQVSGENASGSGSGVIYREDGYIITNAHVVTLDGATFDPQVRVKLSDGRILDGKVVGTAPYSDLAVVKVDAEGLPAIKVANSDKLNVGDLTVAIGAPLNLANTVTSGVVSAVNRGISVGSALVPQDQTPQEGEGNSGSPWDFRFGLPGQPQQEQQQQQSSGGTVTLPVIQTDASINPGNSGGALLNGKGELIGINVAIASPTSSQGVAGSDGLGFAIPVNLATRVADEIIAGEQPSHGLLGASVADSSQDTDEDANHAGGLLVDVVRGGPADAAGLRAGDVITAVDGVPAVDGTSVSALVRMHPGGSKVSIDYTRGGEAKQTEATLGTLEW
ncbi:MULTISPECIES: S1C family serine protease [unclassified Leucobacter]|uniref:S1C family serine protease n=1 Tax=unclassified Leucobacter TaxID=2621730 RepID=UPI0030160285